MTNSERIEHLIESGVDFILIETINTLRKAMVIAELSANTGTPAIVSFVCDRGGKSFRAKRSPKRRVSCSRLAF